MANSKKELIKFFMLNVVMYYFGANKQQHFCFNVNSSLKNDARMLSTLNIE
ncbi:hypothetical protein GCM10010832_16400 [Psychroflexus planctonicus]|uniref:Uncharacterized protein n=1 Tax=Psychroflexus planctonicus TaxID=1526575 RepID=A0ABQ1SHS8_9FLAO|nr:hypothetical protein GCM10010832_16400 [Psychroflexus planctonicus]